MTKTTRQEVEDWLKKAPKSIKLEVPIGVEESTQVIHVLGRLTPMFTKNGYTGQIHFRCRTWEEK